MQFNKNYYYSKQLQTDISNKVKIKFKNLGNKPLAKFAIQNCDQCGFILLQNKCNFCHNQNMSKQISPFFKQPLRNLTFITTQQNQISKEKCYILCIDISGSTDTTYLAPSAFTKISQILILEQLGKQNFDILRKEIPLKMIIQNLTQIQQYCSWGVTIQQIVSTLKHSNMSQQGFQYGGQNNTVKYISRKQIIEIGIYHFLNQLQKKDPNAYVYLIYFNQNITIPTNHYQGIEIISDIFCKPPQEIFAFGKYYGQNFKFNTIKQQKMKIINHITKINPQGQTALGPAITFSFGLANALKKFLHQIIVITDGCSNVGFGQTQNIQNQAQVTRLYQNLAVKYGISNSCILDLMVFSDQKIGYNLIQQLINKTGGMPFSIQITNQQNKMNGQKVIKKSSVQSMKEQFSRYLIGQQQMLYGTKISFWVNNPHIKITIDQKHKSLVTNDYSNGQSLFIGITNKNEQIQFIFTCQNQKLLEKQIKFTLITQFIYKYQKYIEIQQKIIQIKPGSQKQAQQQLTKALRQQMQQIRIGTKDIQSIKKTFGTIKHRRNLIAEDEYEKFSKQFEMLKIQQQEKQKKQGSQNVSIKARRRHWQ